MNEKRKTFFLGMALGAVLAFAASWFAMPRPPAAAVPEPAAEQDMTLFLKAAENGDFDTMRDAGTRIFTPGAVVPDATARLAPYEVNSHPPYRVYALLTDNAAHASRRVLLTLDDQNRVESFLAEETTIVP